MKSNKGVISMFIIFIIAAIVGVLIFAVFIPMGISFTTTMYHEGDTLIADANTTANLISDPTVKANLQDAFAEARGQTENHITFLSFLYQYGWIFVVGLVALVLFVYTRRLVEYGGGGYV
jgi:predicted PurR-regulated permease PerM